MNNILMYNPKDDTQNYLLYIKTICQNDISPKIVQTDSTSHEKKTQNNVCSMKKSIFFPITQLPNNRILKTISVQI